MWTLFEPVLASQALDMGRLWIASLILAAGGPPAFVWLRNHRWRFSIRMLLTMILVVSASLVWLAPNLADLVLYFRDPYATLVDFHYEGPLFLIVLSALVTWAVCRPGHG